MNWSKLSPRAKQVTIALVGAAILAVIAIMSSRRGGATAAQDGSNGEPPFGSTFADNGEAAAGLGTAITGGLGEVATALGQVNDRLDQIPTAAPEAQVQTVEVPTPYTVETQTPSATDAVAIKSTPNGNQVRQRAANQFTQKTGTRAGRDFKVVTKNGKKYKFYESAPGKGDFGKNAKDKVAAGPASKPKPSAKAKPKPAGKPKPKPKPSAKPKPKPSSPSRRPPSTPKAPSSRRPSPGPGRRR